MMPGIFQQGAFQIDPNMTPEEVAARRAALQRNAPQYGSARYVGEGLGHLATGIFGGLAENRISKVERDNRQKAADMFQSLFNGQPAPRTVMPATGAPGDAATRIRAGLIKRGLPEHVADAFVMNFKDESGLDSGINEAAPIVPGSRGGFGLSQWTGPRRRALEAFAAQRGAPVSDEDTQLDFLMEELSGSEAAAARHILSAGTKGEAAAAILNKFLRPAEEHRARREARYLGAGSPVVSTRGEAAPQMAQGMGVSQSGMPPLQTLYAAMASPWLSQEQRAVVQSMIAQQEQSRDPMRRIQLETAQAQLEALRNPQPKKTDDILEYEYAQSRGYDGSLSDFIISQRKAGATSINVGPNGETYNQPVTHGQKKVDEEFAKSYIEWTQGGGADMSAQIAQIESVADRLVSGKENLTGPVIGSLSDWLGAAVNPAAVDARQTVENVVQRNLRLILGGQFAQREGDQLIARAYNPRLGEEENARRLRRLAAAMRAAAEDKQSQVEYYEQNGTLTGWQGKVWSIADFRAAMEGDTAPDFSAMDAVQISEYMQANPSSGWSDEMRRAAAARLRELGGQ